MGGREQACVFPTLLLFKELYMKILYIIGGVAAAALLSFAGYSYYGQKQLTVQLNQVLDDTLKEKEQLLASVDTLQAQLKDKEDKLAGLSDIQGIKIALTNAQVNIENLNKELERVNRDRAAAQEANVSLSTRLQNTTKEYLRGLADIKALQDQMAKLSKEQSPDKKKIEEINKKLVDKSQELAVRNEELNSLKTNSQNLAAANKALEKRIKDLESSRGALSEKVEDIRGEIGIKETPVKQLQASIASLRGELSAKEEKIAALENKLAQQEAKGTRGAEAEEKLDVKSQKTIEQMRSTNESLKTQIARLNEELNNERARLARLSNAPKPAGDRRFEDVKADMDRLSGILMRKEFEIESAKKDALSAKEELVALQAKLSSAQDSLYSNRVNYEKVKELESQRLSMQSQLTQVQQELLKKNELIESLQKNIDYLTMQVENKDREKAGLEAKLSLLDASSKTDLDKERKRNEETNLMYNSLKSQISQFSDAISLKEAEIENKRKEISGLREELAGLRTRSAQLDNDLYEAKENQRKIQGDLSAAVRLNSVLQERFRFLPPGQESPYPVPSAEDKKKAEELKRKIEVILEPDKEQK